MRHGLLTPLFFFSVMIIGECPAMYSKIGFDEGTLFRRLHPVYDDESDSFCHRLYTIGFQ